MTRNYLCYPACALLLMNSLGVAATRIERDHLVFDGLPEVSADLATGLAAYLDGRQANPLGWSPTGQLLMSTRFGDVEELHVIDHANGARRQLTFADEPIDEGAFSPDPARPAYVFQSDAGGTGRTQIYYQHVGDPARKLLTDGKSVNGGAVWSNSGHELAFFSTARDGVDRDVDIAQPEAAAVPRVAVTGDDADWYPLDWSPDDRRLLVMKSVSSREATLYVVDLTTGQKREVDPAPVKGAIAGAKFSRDGQGVYVMSDRDADFTKLRYVNLFTGEKTAVSAPDAGDVEEFALSRDGHYLGFVTNAQGQSKIELLDLHTHQNLLPPTLPAPGIIGHLSFDVDGKRLAFAYSSFNRPRDIYVVEMAANRTEAWTHSETGPVNVDKFSAPRLVQVPTFDRFEGRPRLLPVYVYEPATPGAHPVLIVLHGGPDTQFRPTFDPFLQYVVNELGYAVVAPNVRGSSGYGKAYAAADDGVLRDDAVKDVGALIVWLGSQSSFDAKRLVVAGSGNGGYLALAALVNYNDRLNGGIDMSGMSDFITFLTATAPYLQRQERAEYGDERVADMRAYLRRISPLTNADRITKRLLVIHGKNDVRVSAAEADQIVNRLRSRGGEVGYLRADDEGENFVKKPARDAYYLTVAQFLQSLR